MSGRKNHHSHEREEAYSGLSGWLRKRAQGSCAVWELA